MTKDPKINNWIHNSPITGFKLTCRAGPPRRADGVVLRAAPWPYRLRTNLYRPIWEVASGVVCRRCCTQIRMICTVAALAEFETAAIPNGGSRLPWDRGA